MFPATKIEVIHHAGQRYNTVGDWWTPYANRMNIRVSALGADEYEFLVVVHELIEAMLCKLRGIDEKDVDQWDKSFTSDGEPGDSPLAPYHKEHCFATRIERLLADEIGVAWDAYEATINELCESASPAEEELEIADPSGKEHE